MQDALAHTPARSDPKPLAPELPTTLFWVIALGCFPVFLCGVLALQEATQNAIAAIETSAAVSYRRLSKGVEALTA